LVVRLIHRVDAGLKPMASRLQVSDRFIVTLRMASAPLASAPFITSDLRLTVQLIPVGVSASENRTEESKDCLGR